MMRAILSVKNNQIIAEKGQKIHTLHVDLEPGSILECDVLGLVNDYKAKGKAQLEVIQHYLGDKKIWFRKNPRNNDRKRKGHRDHKTILLVKELQI